MPYFSDLAAKSLLLHKNIPQGGYLPPWGMSLRGLVELCGLYGNRARGLFMGFAGSPSIEG